MPDSAPWQSAADLPEGVRISTEFPSLTRRFLDSHGVKAMVIPSYGATEAKVPDIVDAIVDLTETGSSLRKNGLRILETLLTSYTELIASGPAFADRQKRAAMEDIALLLRGAIQARGNVLLKLNVAADRLAAVTDMLPALSSPTITTLARGEHERGGDRGAQARRQHADPRPEGGRRAGHPGDPHLQDRRVAVADRADSRAGTLAPADGPGPAGRYRRPGAAAARLGPPPPRASLLVHHRRRRRSRASPCAMPPPASCARRPASWSTRRCLGEPIAQNTIEFSWAGYLIIQGQTFYAVLVESAEVSLEGLDHWEQAIDRQVRLAVRRRSGG